MLTFPTSLRVFAHRFPTDMRKSFHGLVGIIESEIEPPKAYVIESVRYTYACAKCRDGKQVVTTQKPPQAVEKSPFGARVLAWLVVAQFERHLPVYRHQEMLLGPLKLWLSRTPWCGLLRATAEALGPLERKMIECVLQNGVLQADETPVRFLGPRPGKAAQGYLFGYAGVDRQRFVFYDFPDPRAAAREVPRSPPGTASDVQTGGSDRLHAQPLGRIPALPRRRPHPTRHQLHRTAPAADHRRTKEFLVFWEARTEAGRRRRCTRSCRAPGGTTSTSGRT